jgi:hypothetical protein
MLLPALSKAKAKAQGAVCLGNLKQLGLAWTLYAEEANDWVPPNNGAVQRDLTWVQGFLTLENQNNNPDNTNTVFLKQGHLWPYLNSLDVWKCPSDKSTALIKGQRHRRVRSVTMNSRIGDYDPLTGKHWNPQTVEIIRKTTEMPAPSLAFVMLDERADSINDSYFWHDVPRGFNPDVPDAKKFSISDYPSHYHNRAGAFNFADGHAELKRASFDRGGTSRARAPPPSTGRAGTPTSPGTGQAPRGRRRRRPPRRRG